MKTAKVIVLSLTILMILAGHDLLFAGKKAYNYSAERIIYLISPLGKAEYRDFGVIEHEGKMVNVITFKTKVFFFEDTEKIYSDPDSLLPLKVERYISNFWAKEYIVEEYDQKKFTFTCRKYKKGKIIQEETAQSNGPIHNAITLPFYLRSEEGLKIGWCFNARLPAEFKMELVSIDEIKVPAGKFQAYHFKSFPDKFEIWVNKEAPQVPIKVQGKGVLDYVLVMKKFIPAVPLDGEAKP